MKNVLITGAGRGIGFALATEFATHGYHVLATYREEKSAQELLNFARNNASITTATVDVADQSSFQPLKVSLKKLGSLDALINNAGVVGTRDRPMLELDLKEVDDVFQVNTFGPMRVAQVAIPFMNRGGAVVQITSLMGSIADNQSGSYYDYRMSKSALNMFNSCLAKEFPQLVCLTLHPGWVQTDMGGAGATVSPTDSARGIFRVISDATLKQSGQFFDYTGKSLPW